MPLLGPGCRLERLKGVSLLWLAERVGRGEVCIANLHSSRIPLGHYVAFAGASQYGIYFVDCGHWSGWKSLEDCELSIAADSRYCLFISRSAAGKPTESAQTYSLDAPHFSVDIGKRAVGLTDLTVDIPVYTDKADFPHEDRILKG